MKAAISSASLHQWGERMVVLVAVLAILTTTVSSALASGLPTPAENRQSLIDNQSSGDALADVSASSADAQQARAPLDYLQAERSDAGYYSLWRPATWIAVSSDQARLVLTPAGQNHGVRFTIDVATTRYAITFDDVMSGRLWFDRLVYALPNSRVEWQSRWISGNVAGFEARYTYRNDDTAASRWVRLLYVGTHEYWLVAEAPSAADFDAIYPMFLAMMVTFRPDGQVDPAMADTSTQ